ncbi:hypothetical protein [Rhizobium freirei]|uniref:hypothetical protein n=1 Tax=Rhizobium freirei TaxID=1353277 RepID=UPI0012FAAD31|nr:hypothetical protein [Rhizobium freirei]
MVLRESDLSAQAFAAKRIHLWRMAASFEAGAIPEPLFDPEIVLPLAQAGVRLVLFMSAFQHAKYKDGRQKQHQRVVEGGEQTKQFHDVSPPEEKTDQNDH